MRMVSVVAHRGFPTAAPENTLASFRRALELGPDMVECDVRQTRDGHLVVIHDPTVDRTTNGRGAVADMTLEQIRALDAGSWFGPEFADERVPTLDETLELVKGKSRLIVEIKEEGTEDAVVSAVQARGTSGGVLIASFMEKVGLRTPELEPEIPFILLAFDPNRLEEDEAVHIADEAAGLDASVLGLNYRAITPAVVRAANAANVQLMAWTVDEADDIRAQAEMGVDMIASNRLDVLIGTLGEMGLR